MDEDQKKRIAIFRFGAISDFFARDYMERGERERLLRNKCAQRWQIPLPLPAPAGDDGQQGRLTCQLQALRGRSAQRHLAE
ncbi:hypothetical protein DFAR_3250011 [Desulfarculales bacterium]